MSRLLGFDPFSEIANRGCTSAKPAKDANVTLKFSRISSFSSQPPPDLSFCSAQLGPEDRAALAAEGCYADDFINLQVIRAARSLAGITQRGHECPGDRALCGCRGCPWEQP